MCKDEVQHLNSLRNRSQYEGYNNPLISWTFDKWLDADWGNPKIRGTVRDGNLNHGPRAVAYNGDVISGEINAL